MQQSSFCNFPNCEEQSRQIQQQNSQCAHSFCAKHWKEMWKYHIIQRHSNQTEDARIECQLAHPIELTKELQYQFDEEVKQNLTNSEVSRTSIKSLEQEQQNQYEMQEQYSLNNNQEFYKQKYEDQIQELDAKTIELNELQQKYNQLLDTHKDILKNQNNEQEKSKILQSKLDDLLQKQSVENQNNNEQEQEKQIDQESNISGIYYSAKDCRLQCSINQNEYQSNLKSLQEQILQQQQDKIQLELRESKLKQQIEEFQQKMQENEEQYSQLLDSNKTLNDKISQQECEMQEYDSQISMLNSQIQQNQEFKYKLEQQLKIIIQQEEPDEQQNSNFLESSFKEEQILNLFQWHLNKNQNLSDQSQRKQKTYPQQSASKEFVDNLQESNQIQEQTFDNGQPNLEEALIEIQNLKQDISEVQNQNEELQVKNEEQSQQLKMLQETYKVYKSSYDQTNLKLQEVNVNNQKLVHMKHNVENIIKDEKEYFQQEPQIEQSLSSSQMLNQFQSIITFKNQEIQRLQTKTTENENQIYSYQKQNNDLSNELKEKKENLEFSKTENDQLKYQKQQLIEQKTQDLQINQMNHQNQIIELEQQIEQIKTQNKTLSDDNQQLNSQQHQLQTQQKNQEEENQALQNSITYLNEQIQLKDQQISKTMQNQSMESQIRTQLEQKENEIQKLQEDNTQLNLKNSEFKQKSQDSEQQCFQYQQQNERLRSEISRLEQQLKKIDELQFQLDQSNQIKEDTQKDLEDLQFTINEYKNTHRQLRQEKQELFQQLNSIQMQIKQLNQNIQQTQNYNQQLNTENQQLLVKIQEIESKQNIIKQQNEEEVSQLNSKIADHQVEIRQFQQQQAQNEQQKDQINELQKKNQEIEEERTQLLQQLQQLKNEKEQADQTSQNQSVAMDQLIKAYTEMQAKLQQTENEVKNKEVQIQQITQENDFNQNELAQERQTNDKLNQQNLNLTQEKNRLYAQLNTVIDELQKLQTNQAASCVFQNCNQSDLIHLENCQHKYCRQHLSQYMQEQTNQYIIAIEHEKGFQTKCYLQQCNQIVKPNDIKNCFGEQKYKEAIQFAQQRSKWLKISQAHEQCTVCFNHRDQWFQKQCAENCYKNPTCIECSVKSIIPHNMKCQCGKQMDQDQQTLLLKFANILGIQLPKAQNYEQYQSQIVQPQQQYVNVNCTLCKNNVDQTQLIVLSCNHPYCRGCIFNFAASKYNSDKISPQDLSCVACYVPFTDQVLQELFTAQVLGWITQQRSLVMSQSQTPQMQKAQQQFTSPQQNKVTQSTIYLNQQVPIKSSPSGPSQVQKAPKCLKCGNFNGVIIQNSGVPLCSQDSQVYCRFCLDHLHAGNCDPNKVAQYKNYYV